MIVTLSRQELSIGRQAATARWQLARAAGVQNQRRDSRTDSDIDLIGIYGEMAVAKALALDYSPQAIGVDDGMDMWCGNFSIDVKSSFHIGGRLLFKSVDAFCADIAILVEPGADGAEFNIVGGIRKGAFIRKHYTKDLGHGEGAMVDQAMLSPLYRIWEFLTMERLNNG